MTETAAETISETTSEDAPLKFRRDEGRRVLAVHGPDALDFLQGLLTNDVARASDARLVYAALLSPQGKFLAEMMVRRAGPERFLLDIDAATAAGLVQRLTMYKLRAKVALEPAREGAVIVVWGAGAEQAAADALPDPRSPALGRRYVLERAADAAAVEAALREHGAAEASRAEWRKAMIAAKTPLSGEDLAPNESYPLELEFERIAGVDFKKGCYVGQEVTARMKHKATLKKGLYRVAIDGPAPAPGAEIESDGRPAGRMGASEGGEGLALLRHDRITPEAVLTAGEARLAILAEPQG